MNNKKWLTKTISIIGTILVIIPIVAPIVFSFFYFINTKNLQIDYLMPAELGLIVLIGTGLLLWAAIRSRAYIKWMVWCIGIAIALLAGSQLIALKTGIASGITEPVGWIFRVILIGIIGYDLAVAAIALGGILLCRHLFRTVIPLVI